MGDLPTLAPLDWRDRVDGHTVIVSFSGGKDSAATCIMLRRLGVPFEMVFCDTGWEAEATYDYIANVWEPEFGPVTRIAANEPVPAGLESETDELEAMLGRRSDMVRICLRKAMLPSRMRRWCTDELKVAPFLAYVRARLDAGERLVNAVGVRGAESRKRATLDEWDQMPTEPRLAVWRPLFRWTYDDVVRAHQDANIVPNPLYLQGAHRVGCWLCIQARKAEIAHVASHDPARIAVIRRLEEVVGDIRATSRGCTTRPGWYMNPTPTRDPVTRKTVPGGGGCWPIGRVVEWARGNTLQGVMDFGVPHDGACMRWGFCEHPDSEVQNG